MTFQNMTNLSHLSNEPTYNIKSVAQQTGIAATTLRAWERRYGALKPMRSEGNYRLYSDRQVAELRWLKDLVGGGMSISRAVLALTKSRESEAAPLSEEEWQTLRARLRAALINLDEGAASRVLAQAHPLEGVCVGLIAPVLTEIGQDWHDGKIGIATEHFASQFLMGHLFSVFNSLPNMDGKLVIAGCAPKELHQIGSLMLAVLLRSEGVNVRYFGSDVPLEEWNRMIYTQRPEVVALSCSQIEFGHKLIMLLPFSEKVIHKHPSVVLGGMAFSGFANTYPDKPNIYVEQTLRSGVDRIIGLLEE